MTIAITREVSPKSNERELTHIDRTPIDLQVARAQHRHYVSTLSELGCQLLELPEEPSLPDPVFVEDIAVILPAAVATSRGANSRRAPPVAFASFSTARICATVTSFMTSSRWTTPAH